MMATHFSPTCASYATDKQILAIVCFDKQDAMERSIGASKQLWQGAHLFS